MIGELLELGLPGRVDRPVLLVIPAGPIFQEVAGPARRNFVGIVEARQAHALLHQFVDLVEMRKHHVSTAATGEDHDGVGPVEDLRVFRPAVAVDHGFHVGQPATQTFRQQEAAGQMFVIAITVAGSTRDKDDLLLGARAFAEIGRLRQLFGRGGDSVGNHQYTE